MTVEWFYFWHFIFYLLNNIILLLCPYSVRLRTNVLPIYNALSVHESETCYYIYYTLHSFPEGGGLGGLHCSQSQNVTALPSFICPFQDYIYQRTTQPTFITSKEEETRL
jgi:hypothetical protein